MKIRALTIFIGIIGFALLMQSASGGRAAIGGMDCTGAPNASSGCSGGGYCHSGGTFANTSFTVSIKDVSGNIVTSYVSGETYTVEFEVTAMGNPVGYGMQAVVLDANNNNIGDWTATTTANTQLVNLSNGREIIEHQGISTTGIFRGTWTAPVSGTGAVKIYGSAVVVNSNGSTGGDQITNPIEYTLSESVVNSVANVQEEVLAYNLYPNPNNGLFYLASKAVAPENIMVQLIDIRGVVVAEEEQEGAEVITVNWSEIPTGLYWVHLTSNAQKQTIPMVVK